MRNFIVAFTLTAFLSMLFLSGCTNTQSEVLKPTWLVRWLNEPACELPCWEGITPGMTTAQEGYEKLTTLPDVTEFWMPSERTSMHVLSWGMTGCGSELPGWMYFDSYPSGVIQWISLRVYCYDHASNLQEFIDAFGEPEYQWVERNSAGCTIKLMNIEKGIILSVDGGRPFSSKELKPSSEVFEIYLMPPKDNLQQAVDSIIFPHEVDIQEWQGYGDAPCKV